MSISSNNLSASADVNASATFFPEEGMLYIFGYSTPQEACPLGQLVIIGGSVDGHYPFFAGTYAFYDTVAIGDIPDQVDDNTKYIFPLPFFAIGQQVQTYQISNLGAYDFLCIGGVNNDQYWADREEPLLMFGSYCAIRPDGTLYLQTLFDGPRNEPQWSGGEAEGSSGYQPIFAIHRGY
jgi:hypothetical protein